MVRNGEDHDAIGYGPIDDGEGEASDHDSTQTVLDWRSGMRKRNCMPYCHLHRLPEALTNGTTLVSVVLNLSKKLEASRGDEPCGRH